MRRAFNISVSFCAGGGEYGVAIIETSDVEDLDGEESIVSLICDGEIVSSDD